MPISLADYSPGIKAALKRVGFACIYVVSADIGLPRCRVGYAIDLPEAVTRLRRSSPAGLALESALWVPDRGIATNIARATLCDLDVHKAGGGWLQLEHGKAAIAVELAAFRIHPHATMVWHEQMLMQIAGVRAA